MASKKKKNNKKPLNNGLNITLGAKRSGSQTNGQKVISDEAAGHELLPGEVVLDEEQRVELRIPEESENPADKELVTLAADSVRSYYTFINLAALVIVSFAIALTLIFIRETEQYSVDNIQLTAETFFDGTYTASLSNRYINEAKLGTVVEKLSNAVQYAYGFGADMPLTPVIPDPLGQPGDHQQNMTTTTWYYEDNTTTTTTQPVIVSVNDSFTGTPVTMPTVTIDVESDFTGVIKHTTTTTTTSLTTTKSYSPTATAPPSTSTTTTAKTTTAKTTTTTTPTETTPPEETTETPSETTEPDVTPTVTEPPEAEPDSQEAP